MIIFLYSQPWGNGIETPYLEDADVVVLCTNASSNDNAILRLPMWTVEAINLTFLWLGFQSVVWNNE